MNDFIFQNKTKIIFGRNTEQYVGKEAAAYSNKLLLVYGGGSIKKIGVYDKVIASLKSSNIEISELGGVQPNPRLDLVYEGIKTVKEKGIGIILAVGGGSAIDTAKAIALGAVYDGDVWDFYDRKASPKGALPIGVVLTIPAAGSESSDSSVITKMDTLDKRGFSSKYIYPSFAILNPESTYSLPPYQIACGASDIMAHMMERYFVNTKVCDLTDRLIEGALKTMLKYTPLAIQNPTDYDTRAEIMWTGTIAHNNLLDAGRGGDWASHTIEHQLSAFYDIAHGAGLSIIFPAWIKYTGKVNPKKIMQFVERVFDIKGSSDDETVTLAAEKLEQFYKSIGLPVRMSEAGIGTDKIPEMAEKAVGYDGKIGCYVELSQNDVEAIYNLAK